MNQPTTPASQVHVRVEQVDGYTFRVRFDDDKWSAMLVDEPPPLGNDAGPNPTRLLGAAVADCLCASLLFCCKKANVPVELIDADVFVEVVRNERRRLRIPRIRVIVRPTFARREEDVANVARCIDMFEDFCLVTESVREGIDVSVQVEPMFEEDSGPES